MARVLPLLIDDTKTYRTCGECNLCCTVQGVEELQKPINVKCTHLNVLGRCGCYVTRPASCQTYKCLWLQGYMPEAMKPSRSRAVMEHNTEGDMLVMRVLERDAGALRHGILRKFITTAGAQGVPIIAICGDKRTIFNPRVKDIELIAKSIDADGNVVTEKVTHTNEVML